jgi:2-polyprenyl-6-methoxyphenol hydroxylase-like FAD-dependent oxidoreductase
VVGCDGANSSVRGWIGSGWRDLGFHFDWLVVDVEPCDPRWDGPINWQLCDPARPTTLVSGGPGRRRWEFMRLPHETLDELNSEAVAWRLLAPWGVRPDNAKLERHAVYTFGARWADRWRPRSRAYCGATPPTRCRRSRGRACVRACATAANLAWKLDLVLGGRAREALLDTYQSERAPHVSAVIDMSVALGRIICVADPAEAAPPRRAHDRGAARAQRAGIGSAAGARRRLSRSGQPGRR